MAERRRAQGLRASSREATDLLVETGCLFNPDGGCYDLPETPDDAPCVVCDAKDKLEEIESDLHAHGKDV